MLEKLAGFIAKDTGEQNESTKRIVVLRILILSMIIYFIVSAVVAGIYMGGTAAAFFGLFCILGIGIFTMSYRFYTRQVFRVFLGGALLWIWATIHYFGWNIGAQQFLLLLLILSFFSSYNHYGRKILMAIGFCGIRLLLYYVYRQKGPVMEMAMEAEPVFQVLNTVVYFWCISVLAYIFSRDTQALEGKLVEYNNQLERQANTDTLTGLYNRRWTEQYLSKIARKPEEYGNFCVCICDIDFFKKVNDNYGHDFGDLVLKQLSELFKENMAGNGFAARWGGEEFLLVFTNCNGDEAFVKLENIRRKVKDMEFTKDSQTLKITVTYGLAEYDFFNGLDKTIKEADKKLYMGKEGGRDVIIY